MEYYPVLKRNGLSNQRMSWRSPKHTTMETVKGSVFAKDLEGRMLPVGEGENRIFILSDTVMSSHFIKTEKK